MLKAAGTYTLKFIGVDASNRAFAMTYSTEFTVNVGTNYRLSLSNFVGTAFGGEVFSANPIVSVLDKGDNIIKTINSGIVTAVLTQSPTGNEELRCEDGDDGFVVSFQNGYANFSGLYINEAGYPYEITFATSLVSLHISF